jgi:hypothetical protein
VEDVSISRVNGFLPPLTYLPASLKMLLESNIDPELFLESQPSEIPF